MRLLALLSTFLALPLAASAIGVEWDAGRGPIVSYDLHLSRDGGATFALEKSVTVASPDETPVSTTVEVAAGDVLVGYVVARDAIGNASADGPRSEPWTVPAPLDCSTCKVKFTITIEVGGD